MQELERLKQLIDSYDEAYYNQEQSLVSDEEYDAIKHRYLELTGQEEYDYVLNINLKATYFVTKYISNYYIESKIEGNILNIASSLESMP